MAKPAKGPLNVTGRDRGEVFTGTQWDDYIDGAGGDDVLSGNDGNDRLIGGAGNDRVYGGNGNDTMNGGAGNDLMQGNAGNDRVVGGSGSDSIRGSSGVDTLWGGNDGALDGDGVADYFVFDFASDSNAASGIDTIMDFNPAEGDVINLYWTVEADQLGFKDGYVQVITDGSAPTNTTQQATLTYVPDGPYGGYTVLNLYLPDNDPDADMTLHILGDHAGSLAGFLHFTY